MRVFVFRVIQSLLCVITGGGLITLIELRFFDDIAFPSVYAFIVLPVTVIAVFLYARFENSIIFVFIYTVCLTFALEISARQLDIAVLLGCFFTLVLLCALTLFRRSFDKNGTPITFHGLNFLTVFICAFIVLFTTFRIYTSVLLPRLHEDEKYTMFDPAAAPEASPEISIQPPVPEAQISQAGQEDSPADIIPPDPPRGMTAAQITLIVAGAAICILIAVKLYRYGKYKRWLRETLASPPDELVMRFYTRLLYLLAVCGYPKRDSETPFEYLSNTNASSFPLPAAQFNELTNAFAAAYYGGKEVSAYERDNCLALFMSLPDGVRAKRGCRFYFFRYLPKISEGINR